MSLRHRLSLTGVLALGIFAIFAIGASSAFATSVAGQPIAFKAFVDNDFNGTIVGVSGASVMADCSSGNLDLDLVGIGSNGPATPTTPRSRVTISTTAIPYR